MGFVWALPMVPVALPLLRDVRLSRPLRWALGGAWIACALPPPVGGWPRRRRHRAGRDRLHRRRARVAGGRMIWLAASLAMLVVIARGLDRMCETPGESRASKLARMLLWAVAAVVVVEAGLGAVGWLGARTTLVALAAIAAGVVVLARRQPRLQLEIREPLSRADVGLVAALIAAIAPRLWAGLHRTTFLYDTLSYHLHVPVTWMNAGHIGIVPAVFGDPSPAYAPSNLELVFLFLMNPLRSDYLAGVGQVPFAALAVAAIVATAREAGGRRTTALAAALAFVLIPEVWGQVPTAMTDLGLAACLLSSLPFALRLWRARMPGRADLLVFAVAIGLAVGSKYAGVALALPFVAIGVIALVRRRRSTDAPPPARARVRGRAGDRRLLVRPEPSGRRQSVLSRRPAGTAAPLAVRRRRDAGVGVPPARAAISARSVRCCSGRASASSAPRRSRSRASGAASRRALALALLATFWFVIPYQESRFLFAAFGAAAIALARAADRPPAVVGWCGLAIAIGGSLLQWPTRERLLVPVVGAAAALVCALWRRLPIRIGAFGRRVTVTIGLVALLARIGCGRGTLRPARSARTPWATTIWPPPGRGSAPTSAYDHVAYTGNNLAFPLAGQHLANRVAYVNVAGAPADRLHDFGPPGDGTAEPAPYRRGANAATWLANLRATDTHVLFVAALDPIVRRTIAADADGFPVERAWADARPDVFRLRYASGAARVYAVELP